MRRISLPVTVAAVLLGASLAAAQPQPITGRGGVGGSGTANTGVKWTGSTTIGNSGWTDDGTTFSYPQSGGISTTKVTTTGSPSMSVLPGGLNAAADAGSNDTYAISFSPAVPSYQTNACYTFKANTANTGTATLNIDSLGAKTIKKVTGGITTDLADNDIRAGQLVLVCYDGTNFQMQSMLGNAGGGLSTLILNSQASLTAVNCTASAQTLFTYNVPANTLTTARAIRVLAATVVASVPSGNVQYGFKFGATSTAVMSTTSVSRIAHDAWLVADSTTSQTMRTSHLEFNAFNTVNSGGTPAETLTSGTVALSLVFTCPDTTGSVTPKSWVVVLEQ